MEPPSFDLLWTDNRWTTVSAEYQSKDGEKKDKRRNRDGEDKKGGQRPGARGQRTEDRGQRPED
jgi:hypothetical protein